MATVEKQLIYTTCHLYAYSATLSEPLFGNNSLSIDSKSQR